MTNQKQRLICVPCQSVLKNFAKVTEKHLCLSQKIHSGLYSPVLFKKRLAEVFPCET